MSLSGDSCSSNSEAILSAITATVMLVFARGISGMIAASGTYKPSGPWALPPASTTAVVCVAFYREHVIRAQNALEAGL